MKIIKVKSFTNPKKEYFVRFKDDEWHCNCPDFLMRGKELGVCKHILKVIKDGGRK